MTLLEQAGIADASCQSYMIFYYLFPASFILPVIWNNEWPQLTIWTAVFSQILLGRTLSRLQWITVVIVFAGLALTATDSLKLGQDVAQGSILVLFGSAMHALTFGNPCKMPNTTIAAALGLLVLFGLANLVHSITFFHTLLNYPGGATSAGVMKGLQAVLVFLFTDLLYCDRVGGTEMCFSRAKFLSLVTVCGGVLGYGVATEYSERTVSAEFHTEDTSKQHRATRAVKSKLNH
ncbi:hypothetical protein IV203_023087 [Nitzschia inconspicua]|uniref:Uncharacterized protein n=1 Tax=Nitzschia inconspicua TaxID=303405 RepID=A0A9K3KD06_9STRA|nr:hypothetical protein IV203_023087 [Nitzschia inconspicua]